MVRDGSACAGSQAECRALNNSCILGCLIDSLYFWAKFFCYLLTDYIPCNVVVFEHGIWPVFRIQMFLKICYSQGLHFWSLWMWYSYLLGRWASPGKFGPILNPLISTNGHSMTFFIHWAHTFNPFTYHTQWTLPLYIVIKTCHPKQWINHAMYTFEPCYQWPLSQPFHQQVCALIEPRTLHCDSTHILPCILI